LIFASSKSNLGKTGIDYAPNQPIYFKKRPNKKFRRMQQKMEKLLQERYNISFTINNNNRQHLKGK